jgi:hypothetical protein
VAAEAGVDPARRIPSQHHEQARIANPRRREVVLVDLLLEELEIFGRRHVTNLDSPVCHDFPVVSGRT